MPEGEEPSERLQGTFRRAFVPRLIQMQIDEDGPQAILVSGQRRHICKRQGPFRYQGLWWERGYGRDYHALSLNDGTELLVYQELESGQWYLEGLFD